MMRTRRIRRKAKRGGEKRRVWMETKLDERRHPGVARRSSSPTPQRSPRSTGKNSQLVVNELGKACYISSNVTTTLQSLQVLLQVPSSASTQMGSPKTCSWGAWVASMRVRRIVCLDARTAGDVTACLRFLSVAFTNRS